MSDEELETSIAADPDEAGMVIDWDNATVEMPQPTALLNMRVDRDVLDFFRKTGKGYQTRINAVLRSYSLACYGTMNTTAPKSRVAQRVDTVEKGFLTIETADPMRALKTLRALSRRECSVDLSFSTLLVSFARSGGGLTEGYLCGFGLSRRTRRPARELP